MTKLNGWKAGCGLLLLCLATATVAPAQKFENLVTFNGGNSSNPWLAALIQGTDGNLYGTTSGLDTYGTGTVFKMTPAGTLLLNETCCDAGVNPTPGLVEATNGDFYGTTLNGGNACDIELVGCGTIFRMTQGGNITTLYSFCAQTNCPDGFFPSAPLVQGIDGNLYGTTQGGGTNISEYCGNQACGTVFRITPNGTLTTVYSFCALPNCTDGIGPIAGLIQAADGNFYGTTGYGGAYLKGTVFRITPRGTLTTLYSFCVQTNCADGSLPEAGLLQAPDGNFYGAATQGGDTQDCYEGCGTIFKITPTGQMTILHTFDNGSDGSLPFGTLVQANDGNLYGTAGFGSEAGCAYGDGCGTVFKITFAGDLTTLYNFGSTGGSNPYGTLLQDTSGDFYGTTFYGGNYSCGAFDGCGTVFGLSVGLGPFVKTLPATGKVGTAVGILGTGLIGAKSVTFNGTSAQFTVRSSTLIVTSVPTGATTGKIKVTLPNGVLSSNVAFYVLK